MKETIYKCPHCGQEYEESDLDIVREYEEGWKSQEYYDLRCRFCGREIEETIKCSNCSDYVCKSLAQDGMCEECFEKYGDKEE